MYLLKTKQEIGFEYLTGSSSLDSKLKLDTESNSQLSVDSLIVNSFNHSLHWVPTDTGLEALGQKNNPIWEPIVCLE